MKHVNILKKEIDRAGSRSVDRSFFSRFLSDLVKSRSDRIGQPSLMGNENLFFQKFNFLVPFRLLKNGKITEINYFHPRIYHIQLKEQKEYRL